jgi:hypothetical protein
MELEKLSQLCHLQHLEHTKQTKMEIKCILFSIIFFSSCATNAQKVIRKSHSNARKNVVVSFSYDGLKQNINNRFVLLVVRNSDTTKATVVQNKFIIKEIEDFLDYVIVFKYKQHTLRFGQISRKMLIPDQDCKWEFGIDKKPFDQSLDLMRPNEYVTDTITKQLQYFRLQPQEFGDGLLFVNKIE